ncbi:hypothetical protein [Actinacidiphila glaucinigra]|uniref:hypothetical protein n=1 Tax=Actinacidiphila glaucinigra TaxID=235986 RepID=UPI0035DDA805
MPAPPRYGPRAQELTDVRERLCRAGVFAAASASLGAVGHHVASRQPIAMGTLAGAVIAVFLAVLPCASRPRSLRSVAAATLAVQLIVHQALAARIDLADLTPGHRHLHPAAPAAGHGLHVGSATMLVAHTLAALAMATLLHAADISLASIPRVVGRLIRSLRAALARWLRHHGTFPATLVQGRRWRLDWACPPPAAAVLDHVLIRRGPPRPRVLTAP